MVKIIFLGLACLAIIAAIIWVQQTGMLTQDHAKDSPQRVQDTSPESIFVKSTDQFIVIDGATIRVRTEGSNDAPTVILIHGFTFSLETWDAWADFLAADYRVIRYDLLGHGLTGPDTQRRYAPQERADFLVKIMDALGVQKAHIAGNSLGGLIAWRFAASYPDRVEKLALISPAAYSINGVTEVPAEIPPAMTYYLTNAPVAGVRASLSYIYADDAKISEERVALALAMLTQPGNAEAFIHHLEEFTLPDPNQILARISAPTLVMWGAQDALIPVAQADAMIEALPNASLTVYPEAGHVPQEEIGLKSVADYAAFLVQE